MCYFSFSRFFCKRAIFNLPLLSCPYKPYSTYCGWGVVGEVGGSGDRHRHARHGTHQYWYTPVHTSEARGKALLYQKLELTGAWTSGELARYPLALPGALRKLRAEGQAGGGSLGKLWPPLSRKIKILLLAAAP